MISIKVKNVITFVSEGSRWARVLEWLAKVRVFSYVVIITCLLNNIFIRRKEGREGGRGKTALGLSAKRGNQTKKGVFRRKDGVFGSRICFKLSLFVRHLEEISFQKDLDLKHPIQM